MATKNEVSAEDRGEYPTDSRITAEAIESGFENGQIDVVEQMSETVQMRDNAQMSENVMDNVSVQMNCENERNTNTVENDMMLMKRELEILRREKELLMKENEWHQWCFF